MESCLNLRTLPEGDAGESESASWDRWLPAGASDGQDVRAHIKRKQKHSSLSHNQLHTMFIFTFAGLVVMSLFEGTQISILIQLICFPILCFSYICSGISLWRVLMFKWYGHGSRNQKMVGLEAILFLIYQVVPVYSSSNIHEYEGLTLYHFIILIGAALSIFNTVNDNRMAAPEQESDQV